MNLKNTIVLGIIAVFGFAVVSHDINIKISSTKPVQVCNKVDTKKTVLDKYKNAKNLNEEQLKELLYAVGFEGHALKMAWSIAMAESNGRPLAFNGNRKTGDSSYGIFQINMIGELGPDRREKFDLKTNSELLDPVKNAQIAFHMSDGGSDWSAWKDGRNQRVQEFLSEFNAI
jgi:hypothetical protein